MARTSRLDSATGARTSFLHRTGRVLGLARGARLVLAGVFFGTVVAIVATPRAAFAERDSTRNGASQVLTFEAEEGAEDQADALSAALRSRVRTTPGWTLGDSTNSLSLMAVALKCSAKTEAACLQKVGDQLKTDRFFWGVVAKAPNKQVNAEVHLWQRGKSDSVAREAFSEALKDPNDEALQRAATRLFEKLTGTSVTPAAGTVAIHAGHDASGDVFVDNKLVGHVEKGEGKIEMKPGTFTLELRAAGFKTAHQTVTVTAGNETSAPIAVVPETTELVPPPGEPESSGSGRKIVGWGLVGVGAVGVVVGVVEAVRWGSLQGKLDDDKKGTNGLGNYDVASAAVSDPCNEATQSARNACDTNKSAKTTSTIAWVAGGAGVVALGIGAVLLLSDSSSKSDAPSTQGSLKPRVLPYAGPKASGIELHWAF